MEMKNPGELQFASKLSARVVNRSFHCYAQKYMLKYVLFSVQYVIYRYRTSHINYISTILYTVPSTALYGLYCMPYT